MRREIPHPAHVRERVGSARLAQTGVRPIKPNRLAPGTVSSPLLLDERRHGNMGPAQSVEIRRDALGILELMGESVHSPGTFRSRKAIICTAWAFGPPAGTLEECDIRCASPGVRRIEEFGWKSARSSWK